MTRGMSVLGPIRAQGGPCAEGYCFISFGNDASRASEAHGDLRVALIDPLWRDVSGASLLQSAAAQEAVDPGDAARSAQQPLQRRGDAPGSALPDDPRPRTNRDHAVAPPKWRLSVPDWPAELSRGHHVPTVLAAGGAHRPPEAAGSARSLSASYDGTPEVAVAADLRCRLDRLGRVRPPGAGPNRVQPSQTGSAVVSPPALLRGSDQG